MVQMKITKHVERGSWLIPRVEAARAATPAGIVGTGFEVYLRILHPVRASCDAPAHADPSEREGTLKEPWESRESGAFGGAGESWWPWGEVARRNKRRMHPLVQWRRLSDSGDQAALSFPDGWSVEQPPDYFLEPDRLSCLVGHMCESAGSADGVTAAVWNGFGTLNYPEVLSVDSADWSELGTDNHDVESDGDAVHLVSRQIAEAVRSGPFVELPGREYVLLNTSLAELADPRWVYSAGLGWGSGYPGVVPQMFWPTSHEWVIGGDVDLDFTIVGGAHDLIHSIHSDVRFESYIVEAGDDLSQWGDVVNPEASD